MKISRFGRVLRTVAVIEASKGILVLLLGAGVISMFHGGVENVADGMVQYFHLDPASFFARVFVKLASHITNTHLWFWASLAAAYVTLRFIEAYGLWFARPWAEWLAALSGSIYIPFELIELFTSPRGWQTVIALVVVAINTAIVLFMVYGLLHSKEISAEIQYEHEHHHHHQQ
ncbi:MAG TPA: DUF2127 domain-containing protein [Steroidobacteraceae bacterium]|nr:DUF2127 domain-containing protein [Steroidobacteraceae bacterium]